MLSGFESEMFKKQAKVEKAEGKYALLAFSDEFPSLKLPLTVFFSCLRVVFWGLSAINFFSTYEVIVPTSLVNSHIGNTS